MATEVFNALLSSNIQAVAAATASTPSLLSSLASGTTLGLSSTSSIVELSGLGRVFSSLATFQARLAPLRPEGGGIAQNFGADFAGAFAGAQSLVGSFNGLQETLAGIRSSAFDGLSGGVLAGEITQSLNVLAATPLDTGAGQSATLESVGILFQPPLAPGLPGTLAVDRPTLEAAFAADESGTVALLEQAAQGLAGQSGGFAEQLGTGGLQNVILAFGATDQTQSLLGGDSTGSARIAFANLFALEAANVGNPEGVATLGRQLVALSQYSVISSLLV